LSDKIYDFDQICDKVKQLDAKIRFAGVINERGRLVSGGLKDGVEPLETERDDEMLYMELALRVKMRREFDKQLGSVNFALAQRAKALAMSFPLDNDTLYVVAESSIDYSKLPDAVLKIIRK